MDTDIVIAGGGPAGLAAACALGAEGRRVTVLDPSPPVDGDDPTADIRSTAVLRPGRDLIDRAGAWANLRDEAEPLWVMRILDAGVTPPAARDFRATDVGNDPFGWNLPNWRIRRALADRAAAMNTVDLRLGTGYASHVARDDRVRVRTTDGERIDAALLIGADGKESGVRAGAGIGARTTRYGQTAIVFVVTHDAPHEGVSTEVYRTGGAFTLVPMPDDETGCHRSAVVWMDRAAPHAKRMKMDEAALSAAATDRAAGAMGPLTVISRRASWPIQTRLADRLTARRVALMAEAAHAMPPIGAQGLNTSLMDALSLRDLLADAPDPGSPDVLRGYARARTGDVRLRAAAVDALNRVALSGFGPVQRLRAGMMQTLHGAAPVRRRLMRAGLGG